jgi:adenylate kinase family enzyme
VSRRIAIVASASGSGKTTIGRRVACDLGVPFVELDELVHGPDWQEAAAEQVLERLLPVLESGGWVVDGGYFGKIGHVVLDAADEVVWLDLLLRVWLPRLARRTWSRLVQRQELWNGNRETVGNAVWGRDALFPYALRHYPRRRRDYPARLAPYPLTRLRTTAEVEAWIARTAGGPSEKAGCA